MPFKNSTARNWGPRRVEFARAVHTIIALEGGDLISRPRDIYDLSAKDDVVYALVLSKTIHAIRVLMFESSAIIVINAFQRPTTISSFQKYVL